MLEEIQRGPLAGQQRPRASRHLTNDGAGGTFVSIAEMQRGLNARIQLRKCFEGDVNAGKGARRFARKMPRARSFSPRIAFVVMSPPAIS